MWNILMGVDLWGQHCGKRKLLAGSEWAQRLKDPVTTEVRSAVRAGTVYLPLSIHTDEIKEKEAGLQVLC